ncbi:MAG: metal-dependent hydrolase [Elusimicrobia bacterium]|nr:metal-dependent hydrolase [Elusimicrobiota bacterium]
MDPVTHTLAGVALSHALFRDRVGPKATLTLALASNLPDLDALVHVTGSPAAILFRRTFGHSVFTIPLLAAGLAWLLKRYYAKNLRFGTLYGLCLLGAIVHVFFDLINSFGVVPLWPVSAWRPELSIVFIVDLFLTGILAAPLVRAAIGLKRRLMGLSQAALTACLFYFMLCGSARSMALVQLSEESGRIGVRPDFLSVFPEPFGPHRWRGVLRAGDIYRLYLIKPFSGTRESAGERETTPDHPLVRLARESARGKRLEWFFKAPVWTLEAASAVDGSPREVRASDLRFSSILLDPNGDRTRHFEFRFRVGPGDSVFPL